MQFIANIKRTKLNYTEMGIFKYLFDKKKPSKIVENDVKDLLNNYESLKKETERLQEENNAWSVDFNKIIELRQKAKELEQLKRFDEAISVYLQSIEFGESSTKLNINNYAYDIERAIILYSKTNQQETLKRFIENKINLYPNFQETKIWAVRLSKLNSDNTIKTKPDIQIEVKPKKIGETTLGKRLDDFKKSMPEFNFYFDLPAGQDTMSYNHKVPFEYFS
jgi:tetratricopeptide (TPR) repeat protein